MWILTGDLQPVYQNYILDAVIPEYLEAAGKPFLGPGALLLLSFRKALGLSRRKSLDKLEHSGTARQVECLA